MHSKLELLCSVILLTVVIDVIIIVILVETCFVVEDYANRSGLSKILLILVIVFWQWVIK